MKKRYLLFLFIFLFVCIGKVSAFKCSYDSKNFLWEQQIEYSINENGTSIRIKSDSSSYIKNVLDFYLSDIYLNLSNADQNAKLYEFLHEGCQSTVLICEGKGSTSIGSGYSVLFDLQYEIDARNYKGKTSPYNGVEASIADIVEYHGDNNCWLVTVNESESTGKIVDSLSKNCYTYNNYVEELKSNYAKCEENNVQSCYDFNNNKSKLKNICSSTVSYGSYNNPCVVSCLNLEKDIGNIENSEIEEGTCNVSDRILKLIKNVFKWGKYIAPVLVIILSILDFIKAIAAQNDDEMKKAQGRFVKRLIAAALLFIIPFLIEFALDTFHLVTDDPYCDII